MRSLQLIVGWFFVWLAGAAAAEQHLTPQTLRALTEQYLSAWQAKTHERSHTLLLSIWSVESTHRNPFVTSKGFAPLLEEIDTFRDRYPDHTLRIQRFMVSQNRVLLELDLVSPSGESLFPGFDYLEFSPSGKIVQVVGFF